MFRSIKKWLSKPYPFVTTVKQKLLTSLAFGKIVFLFLYIFKPFDINEAEGNLIFITLCFGLITFLISLFNFFILPLFYPRYFDPNKWIIGKTALFHLIMILMISIVNSFYIFSISKNNNSFDYTFFHSILSTILVGIFPLLFYIFISERKLNKQHSLIAQKLYDTKEKTIKHPKKTDIKITLLDENKKDNLELLVNDLIYISSDANYASIFYWIDGIQKEYLIRTSLSKLEHQLKEFDFIVRCHKSYIVNTKQVVKIKGNARGYYLQFPVIDFQIPVSRSFPKEFLFTLVN